MQLNPSRYECPDDHTDVTGLVDEQVEIIGPPVAYRPGPRPFQVIVTCPGGHRGTPHPLTCTGTYTS
jgi:hypothetical protein